MSYRIQQVESALKRAISQVLTRQMSDPRIEGLVSITRISVSPDLRDAQVYVSVVPLEKQNKTLNGLRHASGYIHSLVGKQVVMKTVPRLTFRLDETLKKQAEIFQAIQRGLQREQPADASETDQPQASHDAEAPQAQDKPAAPDRGGSQESTQ